MGIVLKLRSILLEYSGNRKVIVKQKNEIQELKDENIKLHKIIFKLKSKNDKLNEENIIVVQSEFVAKMYNENFDRLVRNYGDITNIKVS